MMKRVDFLQTLKPVYSAKRKPEEVEVDPGTFLVVDGHGAPGTKTFQTAVSWLYAAVYTLKFALKREGVLDFKVGRLECLYYSAPGTPMRQWRWRAMIRVPEEVGVRDLVAARKTLKQQKDLDISAVRRTRWKEGPALQVLHVGPYDEVGATYEKLQAFAAEHGLALESPAHEIYLNDPQRTAAEKLRTIVRFPVRRGRR